MRRNYYPHHLEDQYVRSFERIFSDHAARLRKAVETKLSALAKSGAIRSDTAGGSVTRADSPDDDLFEWLESLRDQFGALNVTDRELLATIERNFGLIDAWNRAKVEAILGDMLVSINNPERIPGRADPAPVIPSIDLRKSAMGADLIEGTVKRNLVLIKSLSRQHFDDVYTSLSDGFLNGKSLTEIIDDITHVTGVNRNKARFWASDQSSKFFGEVNRVRQTESGIPGYIWRTLGDGRVRDTHEHLENTYHSWSDPPVISDDGRKGHPGDDYRCRCFGEPAFGPEYEKHASELPVQSKRSGGTESKRNTGEASGFVEAETLADAKAYLQQSLGTNQDYAFDIRFRQPKKAKADGGGIVCGAFFPRNIDLKFLNEFNCEFTKFNETCARLKIPRIRRIDFKKGHSSRNGAIGDGVLEINLAPSDPTLCTWKIGDPLNERSWSSSSMAQGMDRRVVTAMHEFAHHIHQQYKRSGRMVAKFENEIRDMLFAASRSGKTVVRPTKYSDTNTLEWFAENYALYNSGHRDIVDENFIDFCKREDIL